MPSSSIRPPRSGEVSRLRGHFYRGPKGTLSWWRNSCRSRRFLAPLDRIVAALYRSGVMGPPGEEKEDRVLEPWMTASVTPVLVSNRDMLTCSEQGAGWTPVVRVAVTVTTARTSVR